MSCTTISNGYNINVDMSPCGGGYSNVNVDAKISIESGTILILTNPTFGSNAEIYVNGGILKINGSADIPKNITIEGNGYIEVNGDLVASGATAQVNISDNAKLKVTGDFISYGDFNIVDTAHYECLGGTYVNGASNVVATGGGSFKTKNVSFNGPSSLEGRVEVTATCNIGTAPITINCCKLTANTLLSTASSPNQISSTGGYIECFKFFGAQPLTADAALEIYKTIGGGNPGSATILAAPKSPSPC